MHYEFTRKIVVNTLHINMHAQGALNETNLHIYVIRSSGGPYWEKMCPPP